MPLSITWWDVALRLGLSLVAGILIGLNREEHGSPAGLRTTILVCLAAAIAMIQVNLLITVRGKTSDSFVVMDLMRLPLGILSGMGFIGGGAILRKNSLVLGVTTAATLWFVTVLGLCFGGGQIGLGLISLVIGLFVLWLLKRTENRLQRDRKGALVIEYEGPGTHEQRIADSLQAAGLKIQAYSCSRNGSLRRSAWRLSWAEGPGRHLPPPIVQDLTGNAGLKSVHWQPDGFAVPEL